METSEQRISEPQQKANKIEICALDGLHNKHLSAKGNLLNEANEHVKQSECSNYKLNKRRGKKSTLNTKINFSLSTDLKNGLNILANMNSYFEQSGFYGHPHQTSGMGMTAGAHHDQSATAAYRGFPLSLGMTPYANHHLHQSRSTQDSPYDASITAACTKLYDGSYNKDCAKTGASSDTNGYKDVWNTSGSNAQNNSTPVRPSACTPDSRVGGYLDTANGSPVGRSGNGSSSGVSANAWNSSQCGITGASGQVAAAASGLHQASNHTFYPWMAIAGMFSFLNYHKNNK